MDKLTDAKIRAWLRQNQPDLLEAYDRYVSAALARPEAMADPEWRPDPLRNWLERHHPEVIGRIPLW
jgi:hypothetical protein